jgi:thioredoxin-dependent peroxiredoxin
VIDTGTKAPDFTLDADDGKKRSLRDFAGKTLVLYFYPKDDTPGCTREAQAFSKARAAIAKAGAEVVGVSKDTIASHCRFRDKYDLSIPLLSDPDLTLHKAFGAYGEKTMYGKKVTGVIRSTFIVKDGKVVRVFPNVKVDGHADQVLAFLTGDSGPVKTVKAAAKKVVAKAKKVVAKAVAPAANKPKKAAAKKAAPKKKTVGRRA